MPPMLDRFGPDSSSDDRSCRNELIGLGIELVFPILVLMLSAILKSCDSFFDNALRGSPRQPAVSVVRTAYPQPASQPASAARAQSPLAFLASPLALPGLEPPHLILFVGGDATASRGGIHRLVDELATADAIPSNIGVSAVFVPGATLAQLWDDGTAPATIRAGIWDVVVLQDDLAKVAPSRTTFTQTVEAFYSSVRKFDADVTQAGAATVLFMPWESEQRGDDEIGIVEIATAYNTIAARIGARVAPVGLAFARAAAERPDLYLYDVQGTGANLLGTYLAAAVIYSTVFDRTPEGLDRPHPGEPETKIELEQIMIPSSTMKVLDDIAWRTVQDYRRGK